MILDLIPGSVPEYVVEQASESSDYRRKWEQALRSEARIFAYFGAIISSCGYGDSVTLYLLWWILKGFDFLNFFSHFFVLLGGDTLIYFFPSWPTSM